jgi:hypothetical protein
MNTNWKQVEKEFDEKYPLGTLPEQKDILFLLQTFAKMANPPKTMTEVIIAEQEGNRQRAIREDIKFFFRQKFLELLPEERTREDTIPDIANNPRFIEAVEQQNMGFNACLKEIKEKLK